MEISDAMIWTEIYFKKSEKLCTYVHLKSVFSLGIDSCKSLKISGSKVHIFWEGHKNFAKYPPVEISHNFCGILRIYEL